jgi:Methylase involved in ubiquinone/menaquinone biosynthesis
MSEYDAWAPVYDAWASDMTEDVAHYVSLAREADGPIVELMVGSGRVAIEVVRETGKPVLGIDSSPAMLEIARERRRGCRSSCGSATSATSGSTSPRR